MLVCDLFTIVLLGALKGTHDTKGTSLMYKAAILKSQIYIMNKNVAKYSLRNPKIHKRNFHFDIAYYVILLYKLLLEFTEVLLSKI